MVNKIAQVLSFVLLIVGNFVFGWLGKPTEMGLCTLAGAIALAFTNIDKIKRFKGAGFEAEMKEAQLRAMIAKETEPPEKPETSTLSVKGFSLDEDTRNVVKTLGNSKYTWRTPRGISKESGLPTLSVEKSLAWLSSNKLVIQAHVRTGERWGLTEDGRSLLNNIVAASDVNA
jgi:hypothetical protein